MIRIPTLYFLIAGSILAVTHTLAIKLYLYWQFWWFDMPMHLLGGVVAGLGLFVLHDLRVWSAAWLNQLTVMGFVLGVVIAWEVFELAIGRPVLADFWADTSIDIILGLLGGYIGGVVGRSANQLTAV